MACILGLVSHLTVSSGFHATGFKYITGTQVKEFKNARGSEERAPPVYHQDRISLNYKASSWDVIETLYSTRGTGISTGKERNELGGYESKRIPPSLRGIRPCLEQETSSVTRLCGHLLPRLSGSCTNAHAEATKVIQGRAHVEREDGRSIRKRGCTIIVNHISDFFTR